jgi:hypothetical protein
MMEYRVQRTVREAEEPVARLLDLHRDLVAVLRPRLEHRQDQDLVERPVQLLGLDGRHYDQLADTLAIDVLKSNI